MTTPEASGFKFKDNLVLVLSIFTGIIGAISDGMHLGFSAPLTYSLTSETPTFVQNTSLQITLNSLTSPYPSDVFDQMLVKTFYLLGALVGLPMSAVFRKLGPKRTVTISSIISLISWSLISFSNSLTGLSVARIFAGTCVAITLVNVPKYLTDIGTQYIEKCLKRLFYYGMLLGILITYMLGPAAPYLVIPIVGTIIAATQLLLSFFMSESPYYLVCSDKNLEAKEVLQKLRSNQFVTQELAAIRTILMRQNREKNSQKLFSPTENKKATISVIVAICAQQFTGITVIIMSLHEILFNCDITDSYRMVISITFIIIIIVIGYLHEINLLKHISQSAMVSSILCSLSLLALAIYFTLKSTKVNITELTWLPVLSIFIYGISFRFDKGYFPNEVLENYYPDSYRTAGLLFATFVQILSTWISLEIFQRIKYSVGIYVPLYIFSFLNLVTTLVMKFCMTPVRKKEIVRSKYFRRDKDTFAGTNEDVGFGGEVIELIGELQASNTGDLKSGDMTVIPKSGNIFKGTLPQLLAVLAGTLTAVSDGMQYGWTSPVLPILLGPNSPVKVTPSQGEWLETLLMLGSFSGLSITMYLVDKIGRKRSILLASFVTLTIWIIIAVAPRVEYIFVARAFAGSAGNMAFVATPMYIAEIAEQKIRGFLSSLIYLMMIVGILTIYGVAPYVPFYAHCVLGALLALTELVVFPFVPESPYYLLYKDQPEAAERSLRRLRTSGVNIDKELEDIKAAVARQKTERGKFQDLFLVPSNRKAMSIMAILNGAQHFSGISVFLMNIHIILEAAGSIYVESRVAAIMFSVIMLLAATIASFSIDKYGRKTLLISSSLLTGLCLLVLAIYFSLKNAGYNTAPVSWIPIVSVMLYALFFKLGLGMVPIVLTAELFPTKMKAYGMTLADGFYVISSLLSLQVYQRLTESFGLQYPFYVFSGACIIAAIFTYFFIPETKGKTLEEVQMILKGKHVKNKPEDI